MGTLPSHWSARGDFTYLRADGVLVGIGFDRASTKQDLERRVGWCVKLPLSHPTNPNSPPNYEEHFLFGERYGTLADVLKKVDQEWPPPEFICKRMPKSWLGADLERLAREAPEESV